MGTTSKTAIPFLLAALFGSGIYPAEKAAAKDVDRCIPREVAKHKAIQLVNEIRSTLQSVDDQIRNHPYLRALENGQVPSANLRAFAAEQYNILRSDLRSDSLMVSRFGVTPTGAFFRDLPGGEAQALIYILDFAAALGMSEADLQAYEPKPEAQAYPAYATWLANYGTNADIAASFLLNFTVFGENTARMGAALRSRYGFSSQSTAFFDYFGTPTPGFDESAIAVIAAGLENCADQRLIKRSARLLQAYEKLFWDSVAKN
jgi:thiaminase